MPGQLRRDLPRGNAFLRQWRILVMLRRHRQTLDQLAKACGCTTRSIRRDLDVLLEAGFPIHDVRIDGVSYWKVLSIAGWPRGETTPTQDMVACR